MAISTYRKATQSDIDAQRIAWQKFADKYLSFTGEPGFIPIDDARLDRLWQMRLARALNVPYGSRKHPLCIAYGHVGYGGY